MSGKLPFIVGQYVDNMWIVWKKWIIFPIDGITMDGIAGCSFPYGE
jgi:hypothetical protein